ncbi:alkyl/aryl-sulfatase [Stenotrophomonas sp. 24(2023)]|uniref:alkyl/aryl-sulfatase n=1 Tax=Stenotrophomonas sp. 24(2023) TaxID=3068324 RepID=UPI0027DEBAF7|nr:alkyl/aryl-sulfatase [Stenotrophomonas sp. 24(2023)]WMJ71339.1 alkyl/aryl-sulfatase [Stenotrophomonas sp. 24(2023)]
MSPTFAPLPPLLALLLGISPAPASATPADATARLQAHSAQFEPAVIPMGEGVFVAVGYSAANVTLVQGHDGAIIVDTGANPSDAQAIVAAFGERLRPPVKAIIYTHRHPDHTGGASVFAALGTPAIYSHQLLLDAPPETARGPREGGDAFGTHVAAADYINAGVQRDYGRRVPHTRSGYLPPDHTFTGATLDLQIAGVTLQLLHTPGETPENTAVWLPATRTLLAGDDYYPTFPNLSPIRGTRLRPPQDWIASLDRMRALGAEHLVPGHLRPISGRAAVDSALRNYRDAIDSVTTQTLAGIARGATPDELAAQVALPPHLANDPRLQEYYGGVAWTVRGIYADSVGWFDGNPTQLFPLGARDRAQRLLPLLGGADAVQRHAGQALQAGDAQWAAELCDLLLAIDARNTAARQLKARALRVLAQAQINATARNYYLSSAQYLESDAPLGVAP